MESLVWTLLTSLLMTLLANTGPPTLALTDSIVFFHSIKLEILRLRLVVQIKPSAPWLPSGAGLFI